MVANTSVIKFPGFHNPEKETEEIQKNLRQKKIQKVQKDPT